MRLAAAASHFDRQVLTDAYGSATLVGQMDLYDDSKRDGAGTRRRILSVAPDVQMPARRALRMDGLVWLVGSANPDYFGNVAIRRKYVLHEADGLAQIRSFGEFLSGAAGSSAYAALEWVKAAKEIDESSDLTDMVGAVFAPSEIIPDLGMLTLNSRNYLLREPHESSAGFLVVLAEEVKNPAIEVGSFTGRTYDPVNDVWTGTAAAVTFMRLRWQSHFRYLSQRSPAYQAGDDVLICLKTAGTPKMNDTVTLSDGKWQVLSAQSVGDCWSLHARRIPG